MAVFEKSDALLEYLFETAIQVGYIMHYLEVFLKILVEENYEE